MTSASYWDLEHGDQDIWFPLSLKDEEGLLNLQKEKVPSLSLEKDKRRIGVDKLTQGTSPALQLQSRTGQSGG